MCLRAWKQGSFHSTPKDSLQTRHPPSHQALPSPRYAPHKVPAAWPTHQGVGVGSAPCHCAWRRRLIKRERGWTYGACFQTVGGLNSKAATEPSNHKWVTQWITGTVPEIAFLTPWTCVWGPENKSHSTLRQKRAYKPAIHHPIRPFRSLDMPLQGGLAPPSKGWALAQMLISEMLNFQRPDPLASCSTMAKTV